MFIGCLVVGHGSFLSLDYLPSPHKNEVRFGIFTLAALRGCLRIKICAESVI